MNTLNIVAFADPGDCPDCGRPAEFCGCEDDALATSQETPIGDELDGLLADLGMEWVQDDWVELS